MTRYLVILLLVAVTVGDRAAAQQATGPANLDFENGMAGDPPPGWQQAAQGQPGISVALVTDQKQSGAQAARLSRDATAAANSSLNLLQFFDATAFRGRRVRFRMAAKVDTPTSPAQMWMRIDGPSAPGATPPSLFLDTMDDRPIVSSDWHYYEIVADVPKEAARILFGVYLTGVGSAWVDEATFETVPRIDPGPPEGPKAITRRGLVNLMALTRVLGYVRHFHPSDEAASTDWDAFTIAAIKTIESSPDGDALTRRLADVFRPVAPAVAIVPSGTPRPAAREAEGNVTQRAWRHIGFGLSTTQNLYRSERVTVPQALPEFVAEVGGGVSVRVPLSLPTDDKASSSPAVAPAPSGPPHLTRGRFSMADRSTRLATIMLGWNVLQHSYPYFDFVKTSWSVALSTALQEAATDKDEREFVATLRRMVVALHDGQARVIASGDNDLQYTPPLSLDWIDGKVTVVTADAATGALPGDVVTTLDGTPTSLLLETAEGFISSATPQWARTRAVQEILRGAKDTSLKVRVSRGAEATQTELTLTRSVAGYPMVHRAETIAELQEGIAYVDLGRVTEPEFAAALPKLAEAKAIVFDVRTPPAYMRPEPLLSHLSDMAVTGPQFLLPVIAAPDRERTTFVHSGEWNVAPTPPFLAAKKVFLTDAHAIGYAESILEIVQALKLGEIVGSPTAGANGTVNRFTLPGDYSVLFTGSKVMKHDGTPFHGAGITPTVTVLPTREGVAAGRDEVLDRALQLLTNTP